MPELPEVEITARRLSTALEGAEVESALATGVATLKTFEPSLDALIGARIEGVRRIGKMLGVDFAPVDGAGPLTLLIHLMSAGRLQLFDKRASLKDRRSRLLVRITDGRELRLREFGTKQAAWARLLRRDEVDDDEMVSTLGPDAWPAPPLEEFREAIDESRHLHPLLRHQRDIAGIGRSWVDEILWEAKLSPFKKGSELRGEEVKRLHDGLHVLGDAQPVVEALDLLASQLRPFLERREARLPEDLVDPGAADPGDVSLVAEKGVEVRSEEHTSELQSLA